jgi:hypothetical protein
VAAQQRQQRQLAAAIQRGRTVGDHDAIGVDRSDLDPAVRSRFQLRDARAS